MIIRLPHSVTATKLNWAISAFSINCRAEHDGLLSFTKAEWEYLLFSFDYLCFDWHVCHTGMLAKYISCKDNTTQDKTISIIVNLMFVYLISTAKMKTERSPSEVSFLPSLTATIK